MIFKMKKWKFVRNFSRISCLLLIRKLNYHPIPKFKKQIKENQNDMSEFNESEINTADKETLQQNNSEWTDVMLKTYENLPNEHKQATQNLKLEPGETEVFVVYLPFGGPPIGACQITIYTATGPRHPISAKVQQMSVPTVWNNLGVQ